MSITGRSKLDFHIHSNISADGEYTPSDIVRMCKKQGMEWISITDHNSVRGVEQAIAASDKELKVLPGVELDCTYRNRNFHLLGYGIDYTSKEFAALEEDILKQEREAAQKKLYLFKKATGIPVDDRRVMEAAQDGVVTGELIAEFVLSGKTAEKYDILHPYLPGGIKSDMPNVHFYWDFFSEGKPAYVPVRYLSLPDAVSLVHRTGGAAVLAHPRNNIHSDYDLLFQVLSEKIDGIEAFTSYHGKAAAVCYFEIAQLYQLFVTCGSDFHGKHKPHIQIGGHGAVWSDDKLKEGFTHSLDCG